MNERLPTDVAFEYLDDGGVLFCQLSEGAYWQLGPPAASLLQALLIHGDDNAAATEVAPHLAVPELEALGALEAFQQSLSVLGLWHVQAD